MKGKFIRNSLSVVLSVGITAGVVGKVQAQHSPVQSFTGKTGKTVGESSFAEIKFNPQASPSAPNVVWILLDDVGFGAITSFGGLIETPNLDSLALNGLRYTNFHTTAICSPTRAALLTGRNHHSVNMYTVADGAINFPGHHAYLPFEKATAAEIFRENGYNTYVVGKWHLTPYADLSPAGPFNRWPTGRGFDQFYGFMGGEVDQYTPQLVENTIPVETDTKGKHLNTLLADRAITYISNQKSAAPDKPFFLYFAPGAAHAPHQVDREWIDKYKGKFDQGWDKYRETVLERQKKLGVVPSSVELPVRNPGIKAWKDLSADEKKLFARYMEAYAGFLSQTDYEIGRVIQFLKQINQFDNTLIVAIVGDNGASKEGGLTGTPNGIGEYIDRSVFTEDYNERIKNGLKNYDEIGTGKTSINYPEGWAMAANTPFRYLKQDANSEGGTRNPLIIHYPKAIKDRGGVRHQYSHVNSILPTTVELTGVKVPEVVNGYRQDAIEGTSFVYSFDKADAPSRHASQYYEISGSRAIYKDGWKAQVLHKTGQSFAKDKWELYNLKEDFNEKNDLAAKNAAKLKELQDLFEEDALKYNIYPMTGDSVPRTQAAVLNRFARQKKIVLYPGLWHIHSSSAPSLSAKSYTITADVELNEKNNDGALVAVGGRFNGLSFFVKDGKLQVVHNINSNITSLVSDKSLPAGHAELKYEVNYNSSVKSAKENAGTESLWINGVKVAERSFAKAELTLSPYDEGFDIGRDALSPVSNLYQSPFDFSGKLNRIIIEYK